MKNKGFTLIELLVVIFILGIVMLISAPKVMELLSYTDKESFSNSVVILLNSARTYMNSSEREKKLPATNGKGTVLTVDYLYEKNLIRKKDSLSNSVVIVYNNNGEYEYYAFATNGKYYVAGYRSDDVKPNVLDVVATVNYIIATNGITDYNLIGNQLSY